VKRSIQNKVPKKVILSNSDLLIGTVFLVHGRGKASQPTPIPHTSNAMLPPTFVNTPAFAAIARHHHSTPNSN
jgi:hypothetical protein